MTDRKQLDEAMRRLAGGDGQAFDLVFGELWPLLLRYCRKVLPDEGQAEDAAQRALLQLFERASQYDAARPALAWALSFAFWECRTEATRRRRQRTTANEMEELPSAERSPEEALSHAEEVAAVKALLDDLPPDERAILWQDVEPELTLALRGVKPSALRKRRERLLQRLRVAWRRIAWPEEQS